MNKLEIQTIKNIIGRLKGEHGGSPEVHALLNQLDTSHWLTTWVLTPLEILVQEDRSTDDLRLACQMAGK